MEVKALPNLATVSISASVQPNGTLAFSVDLSAGGYSFSYPLGSKLTFPALETIQRTAESWWTSAIGQITQILSAEGYSYDNKLAAWRKV